MAACKAMLRRRGGRAGQLDGDGDGAQRRQLRRAPRRAPATRWFEAPANPVDGLYFPGYSIADAAADLGDSAITETAGVGGFAMAAAPAIVKFVGGTPADATHHSLRMRAITLGANPSFTLPALDFARRRRRHRRAQGGRQRRAAGDQQRHRAPRGGRRPDRRRRHHRADGVLHRGGEGARAADRRGRGRDDASRIAVVAVGGNALIRDAQHTSLADQYDAVCATATHVVDMIAAGWNVVLTHGNGPQVGFILRRSEIADGQVPDGAGPVRGRRHAGRDRLHVPERARQRAAAARHRQAGRHAGHADASSTVDDPAFAQPDKPIGSFMTEEVARAARAPSSAGR